MTFMSVEFVALTPQDHLVNADFTYRQVYDVEKITRILSPSLSRLSSCHPHAIGNYRYKIAIHSVFE